MNRTIVTLAAAALAGRRRFYLLVAFPVLLVALSFLVRTLTKDPTLSGDTLAGLGFTLVLPLLALVSATAVMGPEVDDGSIVYLLAKPVSRYAVATSKYAVAAAATIVFGTLPILLTGLAVDGADPGKWLAVWVASLVCALAYCGLFLLLSTVWRHAVVASLLYVLVWEAILSSIFSGVAWLSVQMWGQRVAAAIGDDFVGPDIPLWWAVLAATVAAVGGTALAGDRLRSFQLRGDE